MSKYSIAAIPTTYKGVNFRSRLEAKWAAFFDIVGRRWEYEPYDSNGYIPDFILYGTVANLLVEVKPESLVKSCSAQIARARLCSEELGHRLLILNETMREERFNLPANDITPDLPYCRCGEITAGKYSILNAAIVEGDDGVLDFASSSWRNQTLVDRLPTGIMDGKKFLFHDVNDVNLWWHEAGNVVQWQPTVYA